MAYIKHKIMQKKNQGRLATLTTDKNGNTESVSLSAGTYFVKEIEAPKGYKLNKKIFSIDVLSGKTNIIEVSDSPRFDPLLLSVIKKAKEGSDKNLKLEGAEYTVKYYRELTVPGTEKKITKEDELKSLKPYKTWVLRTDKNGIAMIHDDWLVKEKSDALFLDDDGRPAGLHGTYSFEETLAPIGYAKTDKIWIQQADFDSKLQSITSQLSDITDEEAPQTISITINKVDEETGKNEPQGYGSLAGAKYDVFFYDATKSEDVKVATLTTDERGFARYEGGKPGLYKVIETKASNGYVIDKEYHEVKARITDVNKANFDYVVTSKEKPIRIDIEKTSIDNLGISVSIPGATLQLLDSEKNIIEEFISMKSSKSIKGLSQGKYYIREIKAPDGYLKIENDYEFNVKEIDEVQHVEVFNEPVPEIETMANYKNGCKNSIPSECMTIVDKFMYKRVLNGEKYIVKGKLIDKDTGKIISKATKEFTPVKSTGFVEIDFNFDGNMYDEGANLVVSEKLYRIRFDKTEKLVAVHDDLTNKKQIVSIPRLKTNASDKIDGGKVLNGSGTQTVVDKIEYKNLYPGKWYTIKGLLMNKETGKPLLVDGRKVTAEKSFMAKSHSGNIKLEFKFNASSLKGNTIVVYENLYEDGIKVGKHADLNDDDQSIFVPEIKTNATVKCHSGKVLLPLKKAFVEDKIEYKNLIKGQIYQVDGTIVNRKTKEIVSEASGCFIAEDNQGVITMDFALTTSNLKGEHIVALEKIYIVDENGEKVKEVGNHTDMEDINQTITIALPEIKTEAKFSDDKKEAVLSEKMKIVDRVEYRDLVAGKKYTLKGTIIDKKTKKPLFINKEEFSVQKSFIAQNKEVVVEMEFNIDGKNLANKELVIFEELYYGDELIAEHCNIDDINQTVEILPLEKIPKTGDETHIIQLFVMLVSSLLLVYKKGKMFNY